VTISKQMASFKDRFTALTKATENSAQYAASCCLQDAIQNAVETEGLDPQSDDFWHIAYDSIQYTSDFTERQDVRDWFVRHGFEW
jgi:hypothetical protein